jgi:GT2 family glycosyltransferase
MTKEGHRDALDAMVPIDHPLHEQEWQANSIGCANPCYSPSGCFITPRDVWDRVGGYDERFTGWSHEDAAFLLAAGVIDRLSGPMYHFWHRSSAYSHPIPEFYYREYASRPLEQYLVDEGRRIERFGSWG